MLYYVQPGDSLYKIANRFNSTIQDILEANVICNPNYIYIGQPLIIPDPEIELIYKAGGFPYYIVLPGDTLWCLSKQFNTSVKALAEANRIRNPNYIFINTELLIAYDIPNPDELKEYWKRTGDNYCDSMSSLMEHGVYYIGTFMWEALGRNAIPYLKDLLKHPCNIVRFYAVISLGRIALYPEIKPILQDVSTKDPDLRIAETAKIALRRFELVQKYGKRIHITTSSNRLHVEPNLESPSIPIEQGSEIIVLKWQIPSPTGESYLDLQLYDYIMVVSTGLVGYMPRLGYNDITFI